MGRFNYYWILYSYVFKRCLWLRLDTRIPLYEATDW